MIEWIDELNAERLSHIRECYPKLKNYWCNGEATNLDKIRLSLWSWTDNNGGSANFSTKELVLTRMVLCLTYTEHDEIMDMGFFEDLLCSYGLPPEKVNHIRDTYDASN